VDTISKGEGGINRPEIPGAILFDLGIGDFRTRPDAAMGYRACQAARAESVEDVIFALATGRVEGDVNLVGQVGAEMVLHAVLRAVKTATGLGGLPAYRDLHS